ncbi:MAG TPA: hypothetical protein VFC19_50695 [Candidatus Limnocylindrales bacterium]|nr:hypothetical protein [Candidatus Limnocylindrales bacterium]
MGGAAGWEPATDSEVALYDALAVGDQEGYFQALGRINLLLPVSADAAAGRTPVGWGTWTANNHTHLLAFTSDQSMRTCLAQHVGGARRMSLRDLAATWPNDEWWLAVNPGLPIEGYLPAWFVAQLARGDARLPGQASSMPRDRLERVQALERAKAAKAAALPRDPIRTIATAGGPLALPPASASPRWARGPSSIVDAEEVTTVLPSRTSAKPYVPEAYQAPPVPPVSGRIQPPPGRPASQAPRPSRPLDIPVVPEPYQAPPLPKREPHTTQSGRFGSGPASTATAASSPPVREEVPAEGRWAGLTAAAGSPPVREEVPAEGRWAGLAEARWTAPPAEEPPVVEPQRQEPVEQRRSLFVRGHAASPGEGRSLFGERRPGPPEESRVTSAEQAPVRSEERLGLRDRRQALFGGEPAAAREDRPVAPKERPAAYGQRPVGREERPATSEEQERPPTYEQRPVGRGEQAAASEERQAARAEGPRHAEPEPEFVPANAVEEQLYEAAEAGNTDAFLSTLLLATVLIPKASGTTNGKWRPQPIDGEPHIVSYTSTQHLAEPLETIPIKFIKLISEWPDPNWSFAVNPGTPVGATLPGGQLLALANWAAEVGLGGDDEEEVDEPSAKLNGTPVAGRVSPEVTILQKAIAPSQVGYYLERGYDRVTGFVHRAHEVGHLKSASQMRAALGLDWEGSPFSVEADEIYLLRWSAHRPSLYRIPYGGQTEPAMHAMQGWVIERAPFRGNGFAPGETGEVIAEFKVDSARLPHGARLLRLKDGAEEMVAVFDTDTQKWLRTDGGA